MPFVLRMKVSGRALIKGSGGCAWWLPSEVTFSRSRPWDEKVLQRKASGTVGQWAEKGSGPSRVHVTLSQVHSGVTSAQSYRGSREPV